MDRREPVGVAVMAEAARRAKTRARLQQKSRAMNLKYAADSLRRDRKVVITACLNHPGSLIYCLDEKLREELTGLSRKQLEDLLETADEDMLQARLQQEAPKSQEQREFEELDFEAVLRQEKEDGLLVAGGGGGGGGGSARGGPPGDEDERSTAEPEPAPPSMSEYDKVAAKRAEIAARVAVARAAQDAEAAAAASAARDKSVMGAAAAPQIEDA